MRASQYESWFYDECGLHNLSCPRSFNLRFNLKGACFGVWPNCGKACVRHFDCGQLHTAPALRFNALVVTAAVKMKFPGSTILLVSAKPYVAFLFVVRVRLGASKKELAQAWMLFFISLTDTAHFFVCTWQRRRQKLRTLILLFVVLSISCFIQPWSPQLRLACSCATSEHQRMHSRSHNCKEQW